MKIFFAIIFFISLPLVSKENNIVNGSAMIYQQKKIVTKIIDSCIRNHDAKCVIVIDKSIKDFFYNQINNGSCYLISLFIIEKSKITLIYIDEQTVYNPIQIPFDLKILDSLDGTALFLEEFCDYKNTEYSCAEIGILAFSVVYIDKKISYYYVIDSDLEPYSCDFPERFIKRIKFKKYIKNIIDKYSTKMGSSL